MLYRKLVKKMKKYFMLFDSGIKIVIFYYIYLSMSDFKNYIF